MKIEINENDYALERNIIDVEKSIEIVKKTLYDYCISALICCLN